MELFYLALDSCRNTVICPCPFSSVIPTNLSRIFFLSPSLPKHFWHCWRWFAADIIRPLVPLFKWSVAIYHPSTVCQKAPKFQIIILNHLCQVIVDHSSEKRGLRSAKCSSKTLQNLLYFMYKKTHVLFFVFHCVQLYFFPYECPGL